MSCPVLTSPFAMSFIWLSGPQFAWEHYLQQVMSQAVLSLLHSVSIWAYLCSSELIWVIWVICDFFLCHLCLSGFPVGSYLRLSEVSVGIYLCFWGDLHWEVSLHCISHLWGLLSFDSLLCTHLCVCCVEIHLHSGTSTLFAGERITKLSTGSFSFHHHHHHLLLLLSMSCLSTTCCLPIRYLVLASISCKPHSATTVFCCPHLEGFLDSNFCWLIWFGRSGLRSSKGVGYRICFVVDLIQLLRFEIRGWDLGYGGDL